MEKSRALCISCAFYILDLQESRFNTIDEVDEGFFVTVVSKGLDKGKTSNEPAGVEVRDVGHRNLFDEEKAQDLDREGDETMNESRRENIEWSKMEGDGDDEVATDNRQLNNEASENERKEVGTELGSNPRNVIGDEKDGKDENERESEEKEGNENMEMQVEEEERCVSQQREEDKDVIHNEKSEDGNDPTYDRSLQEELDEHSDVSGLKESRNVNGTTIDENSDFRTDDGIGQVIGNEDAAF